MQYPIKQGDTLGAIARQFNVPLETLVQLNKLADPNRIRAGASLTIPVPEEMAQPAAPVPPPPPTPVQEIGRTDPYPEPAPEPIDVEFMSAMPVANEVQMPVAKVVEKPDPGAYDMIAKVLQQAHLYTDPVRALSGNAGNPAAPSGMDYMNTAMMGLATSRGSISPPLVSNEAGMQAYSGWINKRNPLAGSPDGVMPQFERPTYQRYVGGNRPPPVPPTPNFAPRMPPIGDPLAGNMGRLPLSVRAKEFALPTEVNASRNYTPVANAFVNTVPWSPVR